MKLNILIILFICVYNALGEISFFPKGQRAEIFEMMDNEVPIFRITLPGNEFYSLKRAANNIFPLDIINDNIKDIINSINHQNLTKLFPEYNFSELLPELPLKDDGYPNIDETKFLLSYQEYLKLYRKYGDINEIIFNIFKNNEYLNLIKVIYMFQNELIFSDFDTDFWDIVYLFKDRIIMDDDGNFLYYRLDYIGKIKKIVDSINEVNFNEMFPGYNFTEILPELPMKENGHPNIDYKKYIISDDEYRKLNYECNSTTEILFNIFNNNEYLNLIKVFHIVSNLNTSTTLYNERIWEYIQIYGNFVNKDEENLININEYYIQMIKNVVDSLNEQNFYEIFPGYNFTEILPELPMKENGHPNIDYKEYIISDEEYQVLEYEYKNIKEILFNIFNNNKYLNLIKVFYTLSNLNVSTKKDNEMWNTINSYLKYIHRDDNGNFSYRNTDYIYNIKEIVNFLNEQNFYEIFPGYNFTEILPELPINENGHPNIDYKKYIISDDEYRKLNYECNSTTEILFNIFNNNEYLNLIKVFYIFSNLNTSTTLYNERIWKYIQNFGNHVIKDEENFIYINEYYIQMIKNVVDSLNEQNFYEIFPGYNFTEILPELPMKENGHPNIDYKEYIISDEEYRNLEYECNSTTEILFNIFNNNKYLNLIKVFYILSNLNVSTKKDNEMWDTINSYLKYIHRDDNEDFSYRNTDYIYNIKEIVNSLNEQNFYEIFPGYNFTEILPELPMNENGHPNIDYKKYIISDDEYRNLKEECNNNTEILINIFNNNEYLNLIKVFHTLYNLNVSTKNDNDEIWYYIKSFENSIELDDNGNFKYKNESYILTVKGIVELLNKQNLNEIFPGYNFTKILPELPMKENGHPNIDYKKYIISDDEYRNLEDECNSNTEILFSIFNTNEYLNLIKVFYTLSELETPLRKYDEIWEYVYKFGNQVFMDSNGNFIFLNDERLIEIKEIIEYVNKQNFTEIFPGINFSEILPELPMNENGHPSIDFEKCIEYNSNFLSNEDDDMEMSFKKFIFEFFNNNEYLNLIKIFYTLSHLYESSFSFGEINDFIENINYYIENVYLNENGDLVYIMDDIESDFYNSKINDYTDNYNTSDLMKHIDNYKFTKTNNEKEIKGIIEFKTKNATMIVEINNQKKSFNKITFSLGGQYSRTFSKPPFNLKIRGGKELFGRRQFKLRGDAKDPSFLKTKLMSDIHNKLGLPSLSANYAMLYINDEFMGLYILTDAYKESWIEYVYGEKDTTNLYKCERCDLTYRTKDGFENENKEAKDDEKKELYKFLLKMTKAKSAADVESIFDIEQFYKEIAIELITSSWDQFYSGHNYYIYKNPKNNKWTYLIHDFDLTLGTGDIYYKRFISEDFIYFMENEILNMLISSNMDRFIEIIKEIVTNVFNPATLFPRIDEIKSFIRPYLQLDKTPNEDGQYPGRINNNDNTFYTMEEWEASIESNNSTLGLKEFILLRYRDICHEYNIECDPNYLDEDINVIESLYSTETESSSIFIATPTFDSIVIEMTTSIEDITTSTFDTNIIETNTSTEDIVLPTTTSIIDSIIETSTSIDDTVPPTSTLTFDSEIIETSTSIEDTVLPSMTSTFDSNDIETTSSIEDIILPTSTLVIDSSSIEPTTSITDSSIIDPTTSIIDSSIIESTTSIEDTALPTSTSLFEPTETETLLPISETIDKNKCLSEFIGYPCCSPEFTTIYAQDEYGDWSYDFVKNEWCGLTVYEDSSLQKDSGECWSEELGYPCCKGCRVYETDSDGSWGYEFNQWCGIISAQC